MKPFFLLIITVLGFNASSSQSVIKENEYCISGYFNGVKTGVVRMFSVDENSVLDSASVENGYFSMKGKTGLPERRRFSITPGNWSFRVFVESAKISLAIDSAGARHFGNSESGEGWSLIWEIEETGSELSAVYKQYRKEIRQKEYEEFLLALKKDQGHAANAAILKISEDSISTLLRSNKKNWIDKFINEHPASVAGVFLLSELYEFSSETGLMDWQEMLAKFSGPAVNSIYYIRLKQDILNLKNRQVNEIAPDFSLLTKDKSVFTLSSTNGKYRLLDFWASWCIPCRQAIPRWKEIYEKYKRKGFQIISISGDSLIDDWIAALEKEKMPWIQVVDEFPSENEGAKIANLYQVPFLPFYVLIDKEGKVLESSADENFMISKIEKLFGSR